MKKPCLDCGRPSDGTRCERHTASHNRHKNRVQSARRSSGGGASRPYAGDYRKRAAQVRAETVRCWICGEGGRPDDPWQADHVVPGDPDSPLAGAHRSCNIARANKSRAGQDF